MTEATNTQEETEPAKDSPQAAPAPESAESAEKEPAPEAPEAPEDPSIVGQLTSEQHQTVTQCQRQQQNLLLEIGQNTVRGYKMFGLFEKQTADFQTFSNALLESLGLNEKDTQYQLMGDGKVRAFKNPQAAQAAPAPEPEKSEADQKVEELQAALAEAQAKVKANGAAPKE